MEVIYLVSLMELKAVNVDSELLYEIVGHKQSFPEFVRKRILKMKPKDERVLQGKDVNLDHDKLSKLDLANLKTKTQNVLKNIRISRGVDVEPFLRPPVAAGFSFNTELVPERPRELQIKFRRTFSESAKSRVRENFKVPKSRGSFVFDEYMGQLRFSPVFKRVGIL